MKNLLIIVTLFLLPIRGLAQEEIKFPELDTKNNVYVLEFSPDKEEENLFSSYMVGTTEKDSLKFWAKGTDLAQRVVVTIYTEDRDSEIKVDIVKDHWTDSKISGHTKEGIFQKKFDTAGKFGIVVTSKKPNIDFHLAVWTTGEIKPFMGNLYYPASEDKNSQITFTANTNSASNQGQNNTASGSNNLLMYLLIGILGLIAVFLALLVFKRKSNKVTTLLIFFLLGLQLANASARASTADVFNAGLSFFTDNIDNIRSAGQLARDVADRIEDELSPSDRNAVPEPDPAGSPRLPSSCIPRRYGGTQESSEDNNASGCACLEDAYLELNDRRFYFEKLRIIYSTTMKSINAKIAFGDTASNVHAVSGLAWQSKKITILQKSIPDLNKAYDEKYEQMIQGLEECLMKIEVCEAKMGYDNWYNHAGFVYYTFMVDKYKRK